MNISFINEKVFYRFVEFTSRLVSYDLCHEDYKLIALNKKEANTKIEKKVKRVVDAFNYLINSTVQLLDEEMLLTLYFLLTKRKLNINVADKILGMFYSINDDFPYDIATKLLIFINSMRLTKKLEYSMLLSSFILVKNGRYPIILYGNKSLFLKKIFKTRDDKRLYNTLVEAGYEIELSFSQDYGGIKRSVEEVLDILKDYFDYIRDTFKVKHLFLYGSVVKESMHKFSDIDFIVIANENLLNYEKHISSSKLRGFLESKLLTKCDVLDFSYSLKHAETKEMNNKIKIF